MIFTYTPSYMIAGEIWAKRAAEYKKKLIASGHCPIHLVMNCKCVSALPEDWPKRRRGSYGTISSFSDGYYFD